MARPSVEALKHEHVFLGENHQRNERRVWLVIALTAAMMVAEIAAGTIYGSMALTADGWHMATHAGAMLIAALAYLYARKEARNPRFTFGTGKLGDLAAFASAIILALVALLIAWESVMRLWHPVSISFGQAIVVAVIGLAVNLASALLLKDEPHHHHDRHAHGHHHPHDHAHGHDHAQGHDHSHDHHAAPARDNNLRAAYLHVMADALTSVLAIVALLFGRAYGWIWLDPLMGIVGALVIARWSAGLIRSAGIVLLDAAPKDDDLTGEIREAIETETDRITDLHVWQVGPGHHAVIVSVATPEPKEPGFYKAKLAGVHELSHVTVEVAAA